jgi:hypothetical protein
VEAREKIVATARLQEIENLMKQLIFDSPPYRDEGSEFARGREHARAWTEEIAKKVLRILRK